MSHVALACCCSHVFDTCNTSTIDYLEPIAFKRSIYRLAVAARLIVARHRAVDGHRECTVRCSDVLQRPCAGCAIQR
jgi:hypothetical protein